jgi:acetyltransferase-like isoleucine patch superfamily enzyme
MVRFRVDDGTGGSPKPQARPEIERRVACARMTWSQTLRGVAVRVAAEGLRRVWEWAPFAAAIGPDDLRARRFGAFGEGSLLAFPTGTVYNEGYIAIGAGTMIGPYVTLTAGIAPGQEMLTSSVVRIGDRCVIGRGSHVVGHWSIDIGDDIQTGPYVYITDQNHGYEDPDEPIGRQWPLEAGVSIGSGSWLGAHAVVLPGAQIGRHVVVAAGAVVRGQVPDHCVVAGVPARVVRRWLRDEGWVDVDEATTPR